MNKKLTWLLGAAALLGFSHQANAAGFALIEQSVSSMGNSYAGGAAIAEDATTIFFNPAGLSRICGGEMVAGFHVVVPVADYDDEGSILFPGVAAGQIPPSNFAPGERLTGNDGRDAGEAAVVGNFYVSKQVNNCFWLGLGVTAPFGLVTDYDHNWKGRYYALRSQLLTVDINPVFAYKVNRCWSIGGGFRALYAHAKLSNKVDYGTIAWLQSLNLPTAPTPGPGPSLQQIAQTGLNSDGFLPQEEDGIVQLKGNAWGWGGNFGILYEPCCGTRFGINWRSQIKLNIKGDEKFKDIPTLIANPTGASNAVEAALLAGVQAAAATDSRAKAHLTLPDIFQISAYHELNSCWAVMADVTYTHWSLLKELRFRFNNPNQPDGVTTLKWEDAFRYAVGVTYSPNCNWKLRTGVAYDETPVRNKEYRDPRIPDNDRVWVNCGIGYQWNSCLHFDIAYAHLFVPSDPKIDKREFELEEEFIRGGLYGKYDAYTDIISAQLVWRF